MIHDAECMMHDEGSGPKTGDRKDPGCRIGTGDGRQGTEGRMKQLTLNMHLESWIMNLAFPIFAYIRG
jgi:hypothetical protein